jgi:hypothetical protein
MIHATRAHADGQRRVGGDRVDGLCRKVTMIMAIETQDR